MGKRRGFLTGSKEEKGKSEGKKDKEKVSTDKDSVEDQERDKKVDQEKDKMESEEEEVEEEEEVDTRRQSRRKGSHKTKHDESALRRELEEEEDIENWQTRTRRKGIDPFAIPPSRITRPAFEVQNPFIEVIDDSCPIEGLEDKICDEKIMDNGALREAMRKMVCSARIDTRAFKNPTSELGGRPQYIALASSFWLITRPHQERVYSSLESLLDAREAKDAATTSILFDNQSDLIIKEKQVESIGNELNESIEIRQEGDDGESKDPKVSYNFNFIVYDKNIQGPDNKVTTLIVDGTWVNFTLAKMFQVSTYGCKFAVKNMEKGRDSPIYLQLWGEDKWRYGILYPYGVVLLEDGKVVAARHKCSSIEKLEKILYRKKKTLQANFPKFVGTFPDGSYVQGILYVSREKFSLPDCTTEHVGYLSDAQLFYQGNIRILAGDTALNWTEKDVRERIAFRKQSLKDLTAFDKTWMPFEKSQYYKRRRHA